MNWFGMAVPGNDFDYGLMKLFFYEAVTESEVTGKNRTGIAEGIEVGEFNISSATPTRFFRILQSGMCQILQAAIDIHKPMASEKFPVPQ